MIGNQMIPGKVNSLVKQAAVCAVAAVSAWTLKPILLGLHGPADRASHPGGVAVIAPADPDDLSQLDSRLALANELLDADAAGLRRIAVGMLGQQNADLRTWSAVFTCWMKVAPQEAWAFACLHPETTFSNHTWDSYLPDPRRGKGTLRELAAREWAKFDPQAARAALSGPGDPAFGALLFASLESDVEYGFALLGEQLSAGAPAPGMPGFFDPLTAAFTALARKDPLMALVWARRLAPADYSAPLLIGWADHDWHAARQWLDQRPDRAGIIEAVAGLLARHAGLYRPQLYDLIVHGLPPGHARLEWVQQTLVNLAYANPVRAAEEAERAIADRGLRASILARIANDLARSRRPKQALEILSRIDPGTTGLPSPDLRAELFVDGEAPELREPGVYGLSLIGGNAGISPAEVMNGLLGQLIWTDKPHALRLVARLPADQIAIAGSDAIDIWANHDPLEAAVWLARKTGDQGGDLRIDSWFGDAELTPDEMRSLSASLPGGAFRDAFTAWVAGEFAGSDPAAAIEFARGNDSNAAALTAVYQQWSAADPQAALAALAADPQAVPEAWAGVVDHAWERDPDGTGELVGSMAPGAIRDAALEVLVAASGHPAPPAQRFAWACGIVDETRRRHLLGDVLDRMTLDLRATRDSTVADTLRTLVRTSPDMGDNERERWLTRLELDFPPPP